MVSGCGWEWNLGIDRFEIWWPSFSIVDSFLLGFFGFSFALQLQWCYLQVYLLSFKFLFLLGFFGLSFALQPWWCYSQAYLLRFKFLFLLGFFGLSFALQPRWCYSHAYLLSFKFLLRHEQDGNGNDLCLMECVQSQLVLCFFLLFALLSLILRFIQLWITELHCSCARGCRQSYLVSNFFWGTFFILSPSRCLLSALPTSTRILCLDSL